MAAETRNIPASVHQRLLAKARDSSRPFNELLQHFTIERFLYRLSKSPQAGRFILKGALMLSAWSGSKELGTDYEKLNLFAFEMTRKETEV